MSGKAKDGFQTAEEFFIAMTVAITLEHSYMSSTYVLGIILGLNGITLVKMLSFLSTMKNPDNIAFQGFIILAKMLWRRA